MKEEHNHKRGPKITTCKKRNRKRKEILHKTLKGFTVTKTQIQTNSASTSSTNSHQHLYHDPNPIKYTS